MKPVHKISHIVNEFATRYPQYPRAGFRRIIRKMTRDRGYGRFARHINDDDRDWLVDTLSATMYLFLLDEAFGVRF